MELSDTGQRARQAVHPAARQRALKTELAQLVHQLSIDQAEAFLEDVVARARQRVDEVARSATVGGGIAADRSRQRRDRIGLDRGGLAEAGLRNNDERCERAWKERFANYAMPYGSTNSHTDERLNGLQGGT